MRPTYPVTELLGDGIGPELSRAVHRLAEALPVRLEFVPVDFTPGEPPGARQGRSTTRRSRRSPPTRVALKHPTTTAEESPNAILRRRLDLSVIHRPVYTIPGVPTNFRRELDLDIVRIATGGTYDDPGRMIGEDGAVSLRIVEREPVTRGGALRLQPGPQDRQAGHQLVEVHDPEGDRRPVRAGRQGGRRAVPRGAALGRAVRRPAGQGHHGAGEVPDRAGLNEYGDFLSDMACGLAGSLGIGASANLGFDAAAVVRVALFDAAHGTAPDIAGKNLANPTAIFLALSLLALPARRDRRRPGGQERDARPPAPGGPHPRPRRPGVDRELHRGRRRRGGRDGWRRTRRTGGVRPGAVARTIRGHLIGASPCILIKSPRPRSCG